MHSTIHELMCQIRDYVNKSRKHYELSQNVPLFSQLMSALDAVEDTQEAIESFTAHTSEDSKGDLYLATYGLLQAMFLQQDAAEHLGEALNVTNSYKSDRQLKEIREIRNASIGHPTKKDQPKNQPTSYHQISRASMSRQGFQLMSYSNDGKPQFKDVSITTEIHNQEKIIGNMLQQISDKLKAEDKAHKEMFRTEKLAALFQSNIGYSFEKARGATYQEAVTLAEWGINHIRDVANSFLSSLERRNKYASEQLATNEFLLVNHAITRYTSFLERVKSGTATLDDKLDGRLLIDYLRVQIDEMRKYAEQIDQEYEYIEE